MCEISTREVCAFKEETRKYALLRKKSAALGVERDVGFAPQRLPLDGTVSVLGEISVGL